MAAILKMETCRHFSMSGINSGHHYLPTYQILMISDNVEFLRYCGGHFENGEQKKLFYVGNQFGTSLSTHISNFDDTKQCWIFAILWRPFWKWRSVEIFQCQASIRNIIIYSHVKFWWYRTILNFYPSFLCRVLAAILKMADILKILKTQNCSSNVDLSLCQILCLYHYPFRSYQH